MCATAGACISETGFFSSVAVVPQLVNLPSSAVVVPHKVNLPSCVVGRRPLYHKVNQPGCEARRCHFIMTCDIFGTGKMNILALCYLFEKKLINQRTVEQHSSHWNQHYTRPNYWKSYWREHSHSTEGFDDSLETCERCSVSEPVFKQQFIVLQRSRQKMWSWVFNINTS